MFKLKNMDRFGTINDLFISYTAGLIHYTYEDLIELEQILSLKQHDINYIDDDHGTVLGSVLRSAYDNKYFDLLKVLFNTGGYDINSKNNSGNDGFMIAMQTNNPQSIDMLMEYNPKPRGKG